MSERHDDTLTQAQTQDESVDPAIVAAEAKRQRTFRRWIIGIILCAVGVVSARLVWGFVAERRLQAQVEEYRAAGEPILLKDFSSPHVKPAENAAVAYSQADSLLRAPTGFKIELRSFLNAYEDVATSFPEETNLFLAANRDTLSWIREARGRPAVDWGTKLSFSNYSSSPSSPARMLNRLVDLASVSARRQHALQNDSEAIESLLDLLAIAKFTNRPGIGECTAHLRIAIIHRKVRGILQDILPTLRIIDADTNAPEISHAARRGQVHQLIRELWDESHLRRHWIDTANCERALTHDVVMQILTPPSPYQQMQGLIGSRGASAIMLHPSWRMDALRMLRFSTMCREAGRARDWPSAQEIIVDSPYLRRGDRESVFQSAPRILSQHYLASFECGLTLHFEALAIRRMAAIALAIRLYEIDHEQALDRLEGLTPHYLDTLPEDPFATEGRPFLYKIDGAIPRLYSVYRNGEDDGGLYTYYEGSTYYGSKPSDYPEDCPFILTGDRPRPKLRLVPTYGSKHEITKEKGQS